MAELYRRSSQYRHWSFTHDQLIGVAAKPNRQIPPDELKLSEDEEHQLVFYFAAELIKSFCDTFRLSSQVRATSVMYFRRFYLVHSVMEHDPRLILPTCVFLAAKSENFFIPIQDFVDALQKVEAQQVLDLEFVLFKSLGFTLTVHNALQPLHGFFLDMQSSGDFDVGQLGQMHDAAKALIVATFGNDAVFLYTPTHIALAALMEANEFVVTQYMAETMDGPNTSLDRLLAIVEQCRAQLRLGSQVTASFDEIRTIQRRLKKYYAQREDEGPDRKRAKR